MKYLIWTLGLATLLTLTTLWARPLLPVDETRYLTVAWEAYERQDFLVSHLNGETYAHKPPILFWLINIVWSLTGVSTLAGRMVAPAAGLACLMLNYRLAWRLCPERPAVRQAAPLMHASCLLWMFFSPVTMFDTLLTASAMLALDGVLAASQQRGWKSWSQVGVGLGLGILCKGPVVLVFVLPAMLAAPWWSPKVSDSLLRWYGGVLMSVVIGACMAFAWAIPSALSGGDAYAQELLFGQTAGRMVNSFAHRQPFWWYLPIAPLCALPWLFFRPVWQGCFGAMRDSSVRFLLSWLIGGSLILSLVSGKQVYYLMPLLPGAALLLAVLADRSGCVPSRWQLLPVAGGTLVMGAVPVVMNHVPAFQSTGLPGLVSDPMALAMMACGPAILLVQFRSLVQSVAAIATAAVIVLSLLVAALHVSLWDGFDLQPLAGVAASSGRPIAWFSNYHGQLNFLGKIPRVDAPEVEADLAEWLTQHPAGVAVVRLRIARNDESELVRLLRAMDRSVPRETDVERLSVLLANEPQMPMKTRKPLVRYVQWIRTGLTLTPLLLVEFQQPATEAAQSDAVVPGA